MVEIVQVSKDGRDTHPRVGIVFLQAGEQITKTNEKVWIGLHNESLCEDQKGCND